MSHNDDLITELQDWRRKLRQAREAADAIGEEYRAKRSAMRDIERSIEEILGEIETGRSERPIMDAINGSTAPLGSRENPVKVPDEELKRIDQKLAAEIGSGKLLAQPCTDEELDRLLIHACRNWRPDMREFWDKATANGANDDMIKFFLNQRWPKDRVFVGADQTKQKHGYTIQACHLWVGPFRGPGHEAALHGDALIARIRTVFGIPQPGQGGGFVAPTAEEPAKGRPMPAEWLPDGKPPDDDVAGLHRAGEAHKAGRKRKPAGAAS